MTDKLQHHELTAEWVDDSQGRAILLTQNDGGGYNEAPTIIIHPWQLRAVCEQFDLMTASDPQAAKTIETLTRRLHLLTHRINHLDHWLLNHSDSEHADLTYEWAYSGGTVDLADEFCAELEAVPDAQATPPKQASKPVKSSEAVAVKQADTDPRQLSIDA
jgi:hypothetical protein